MIFALAQLCLSNRKGVVYINKMTFMILMMVDISHHMSTMN